MISIGQKVKFDPLREINMVGQTDKRDKRKNVVGGYINGVVIYINKPHRWFLVEYNDDPKIRMGFKFDDLKTSRMELLNCQ